MSLPNDKILDKSNLKDCRWQNNVTPVTNFVLRRVENIVGKGENAGYQHFLLFPQCFQKASLSGLLRVGEELRKLESAGFYSLKVKFRRWKYTWISLSLVGLCKGIYILPSSPSSPTLELHWNFNGSVPTIGTWLPVPCSGVLKPIGSL